MSSLWTSCDGGELDSGTSRTIYWPRKRHVLQFLWQGCKFTMATTSLLLLLLPSGTRFRTFWCFGALHGRRTEQTKKTLSVIASASATVSHFRWVRVLCMHWNHRQETYNDAIYLDNSELSGSLGLWTLTSFCMCRQSQQFLFHILLFTSLHVSASTGHPQAKYTQPLLKAITPATDQFLGYTVHY
jgi:hypothetical protein